MMSSAGNDKLFIGVDFSGAAMAGKSIWLASGCTTTESKFSNHSGLKIYDCRRAETLPGSGRNRDLCLKALRNFVESQQDVLIGFDFPFGLPRELVKEDSWESFVLNFPEHYNSPQQFRCACLEKSGRRELKRVTDYDCRAPFSPYNLRIFRQTYYGICDLLNPLVRTKKASILPMQEAMPGLPRLIEICPASTLKAHNCYSSYKGRGTDKYNKRLIILQFLEREKNLIFNTVELREKVLKDSAGDALDSVIALYASSKAKELLPESKDLEIEGYTYY